MSHRGIIKQLSECSMLPGGWDKRFIKNLASLKPDADLTESQIEWIFRLLYKYRAQLPQLYKQHQNNPLCSRKK